MAVTQRQIALIRASFDGLRGDMRPPSEQFYTALFRRAPQLRPLFREDLEGQGMKFMSTLAVIVDNLHDEADLAERYVELGGNHATVGVHVRDFDTMREALIDMFRYLQGDAFDAETEAAWRVAYDDMARAMIGSGGIS